MTTTTTTDRLAEAIAYLRGPASEPSINEAFINTDGARLAIELLQSLSTDLANAEARVEELFAANAMSLKRAHAAEARLKQLDQVKSCISPSTPARRAHDD